MPEEQVSHRREQVAALQTLVLLIVVSQMSALFGLIGSMLSELITNWSLYANKVAGLLTVVLVIVVNLKLGLLPRVDNLAHIGGSSRPSSWASSSSSAHSSRGSPSRDESLEQHTLANNQRRQRWLHSRRSSR